MGARVAGSLAFAHEGRGSSQGRGAVFIGEDALPAEIEYEDLQAKYREEDVRGIPMSVRERYERSLEELQGKLRGRRHARRLGEILVEMGVIDQEVLAKALGEQLAEGAGRSWARCW